jgi:anti-anti-sigma regulatory factor
MARKRSRSESRRISLGEDLRIARASDVTAMLRGAAQAGVVEIDASQVARVDAAGLQALVAGIAALKIAKVSLRWNEPSETLVASAALAGLAPALGLE